jgi:hypothetical protein
VRILREMGGIGGMEASHRRLLEHVGHPKAVGIAVPDCADSTSSEMQAGTMAPMAPLRTTSCM